MNFNDNWLFRREIDGPLVGAEQPDFDDAAWRKLTLPHDWSIELPFNPDSPATHEGGFLDGGIAWYRKHFTVPSHLKGQRIYINFDGVYMNSTTYLNGQPMGTYPFGYNGFQYEITDLVNFDEANTMAVKVDNTQPSSRWYSGSGIYRNVYLTHKDPIHVARHGIFVTTPDLEQALTAGRADVKIQTTVENGSRENAAIQIQSTILNAAGETVATHTSDAQTVTAGINVLFDDQLAIEDPVLWDLDNPYRYTLETTVLADDVVVDTETTLFGVRYFELDADEGFTLNGNYMKLHGVCMHHDLGALGAVTNARAVERQMQIMKDMGVNAIRVSHNPASPELLEACNTLGLLVIDESFDCWNLSKKQYDYGRFFNEWAEHDTKEMVHRGKNEPAIIMWSIGNEIYDTTSENGVKIAQDLVRWVKEVDTTRPTTIGEDKTRGDKVNVTALDPHIKAIFDIVDVVGFNYSENNYQGYHDLHPEWKMYGAETSSATRSRGVYTHPYEYNQSTMYDDLQQSSYDNDYVGWGRTAEDAWKYDRDLKHLAGQFIWTGFDYIGEPTPYYNTFPAKSSYFGAVDTAGFPKDIFYYYQSQWKDEPMVHLLPHWNWTEGEKVRVLAYTNLPEVELILNGQSLGTEKYETKATSWGAPYYETTDRKTYLEWAVPFAPGTLEAIARDEAGNVIATDKVVTAGEPHAIKLSADRRVLDADGRDVSFVTVDVVDEHGTIVPTADNLIQFNVTGAGRLAGVDNGDGASIEPYKATSRSVFSGKALAILQADEQAGEITLEAASAGLIGEAVTVFTHTTEADAVTIVGMETVDVVTDINVAPHLPEQVTAFYNDGTSQLVNVVWDAVSADAYETINQFTVTGTVEQTEQQAQATVIVKDMIAIKPYSTVVKPGETPVLPEQITVFYSDETTGEQPVMWIAPNADQMAEESTFTIDGVVTDTDLPAHAEVRVTSTGQAAQEATLTAITVNGEALADFDTETTHYEHILPFGSSVPVIEADAADHATVVTRAPLTLPGTVRITVMSEDRQQEQDYTLHVQTEAPALVAAELIVAQTTVTEDDTISLRVQGRLENDRVIDLTDIADIDYHYEADLIQITDHKLAAYAAGEVNVKAAVTYRDAAVVTPELTFNIKENQTPKELIALDSVTRVINKEETPTLPKEVTAHYDSGLPRQRPVVWDALDEATLKDVGTTRLEGTVSGTNLKAVATIIVRGPVAVEDVRLAVLEKQMPELPETVTIFYSDGSEESTPVQWPAIDPAALLAVGSIEVAGTLEQTDLTTTATIRITDEIGSQQNVGRAKNGYNYPQAQASFTNNEAETRDHVFSIHDDVISYTDEPYNRWTNWQAETREADWVSITFGDYGPEAYFVDHLEIHWFEDERTSYPAELTIQYKANEQWVDVENVTADPATPVTEAANTYHFDMVKTTDIRLHMKAQADKAIGITEVKVYSKWPVVHAEPNVSEILLDGHNIIEQFTKVGENYTATITVEDATVIPTVTAKGTDNTSITVVPAQSAPSTARIIARAEDNRKVTEYHLHFTAK